MNYPTEPAFLYLKHGMEYIMHHPHKPIMYSRNRIYKTHEIPHKCFFKSGDAEINKNKEYTNLLHTYCDADHAINISDRCSVILTVHLFNGTLIDCCSKKQSENSIVSSNAETRAIHTGVLDSNWVRNFFKPIGSSIGTPSKLYEDNQATIKRFLAHQIKPQARPPEILITALHELCLRKQLKW